MKHRILLFLICTLVVFSSCGEKTTKQIVKEMIGKELLFDINPKDIVVGQNKHTNANTMSIVTYVDSLGCVSCKLKLPKLKQVNQYLDSIAGEHIPIIFVVHESVKRDMIFSLKADKYVPDEVIVDTDGKLCKKFDFPEDNELQTFLLDKEKKIVAVGNPTNGDKILSLYVKLLMANKMMNKK